ncbi:MAG: hypothetical protein OEZ24_02140 [Candidatus Bathyarchaeota archaeon]|nr:hypothetical protein [Candidatus Bathyarchaeota archaeon]
MLTSGTVQIQKRAFHVAPYDRRALELSMDAFCACGQTVHLVFREDWVI